MKKMAGDDLLPEVAAARAMNRIVLATTALATLGF